MSVLDDLGVFLQTASVGTLATTLFRGGLPLDTPTVPVLDAIMALIVVPGLPSVHSLLASAAPVKYDQPVVQVLTRGNPYDFAEAFTRALAAFAALDGVCNVTMNGIFYLSIFALQSPYMLRQADEMGRPHVAFNIRCAKRP